MQQNLETRKWGWLVLFASTTTLVCCALPILLVSLGFGALWATIYANFGAIGFVSQHKLWFFIGSAALLLFATYALYRPGRTCPSDPVLAVKCQAAELWNKRLLVASGILWVVGMSAAYLSVPLLEIMGG